MIRAVDFTPPGTCTLFGGLFDAVGSLFGGGDSQSSVQTQGTTVNVDVTPQIGIAIDTAPVSEAIKASTAAFIEADAKAKAAQAGALGEAVKSVVGGLSESVKTIGLTLFAALGLYLVFAR